MQPTDPSHPGFDPHPRAWRRWLPWLLLCAWLIALGFTYAHIPPSPDQAELEYVAQRVLEGDVLYRDIIDMNWPGGVWLHELSAWANPARWHPWRVVDFGFILLGTLAGAAIARKWWGRTPARWVWWLCPLLSITAGGWWFAGQRDAIVGHLAIVAAWFHLLAMTSRERERAEIPDHPKQPNEPVARTKGSSGIQTSWMLLVGFIIALAVLLKPTAIVLGPVFVVHAMLFGPNGARVRTGVVEALLAGIAGAATLGVALSVLLLQGVQFGDFWNCAFIYNAVTQHWEQASTHDLLGVIAHHHAFGWHWIVFGAILSAIWMLFDRRRSIAVRTILPMLWLVGLGSFVWQGKGYAYHLAGAYQPMVLLALIGIGVLSSHMFPRLRAAGLGPRGSVGTSSEVNWFARAVVVVVLAGAAFKLGQLRHPASYAMGLENKALYHARFADGEGVTLADLDRIVALIGEGLDEGDTVFMWGTMHAVHLRLRVAQSTRFYYSPMLLQAREPLPMADEWVGQYTDDLRAHTPAWCIINRVALERCGRDNPPVARVVYGLLGKYTLVKSFGGADVYRKE